MSKKKHIDRVFEKTEINVDVWLYLIACLSFAALLCYYIQTRYHHLIHPLFRFLVPALLAFLCVAVLTPVCIWIARRFQIVDKNAKKSGPPPVPLLGGLSIYTGFLVVCSLYQPWSSEMTSIVGGATIIFILGVLDDIQGLSSGVRLVGQFAAACLVMSSGLMVSFMPDTLWGNIAAAVITLLWILGIVNATNFIDGVDGLATGFAVIAAGFFFLITLHLEEYPVALIASIVVGTGLGFLIYNFKPAKIYLGDGGSTLLGFLLACIALFGSWSRWGPIIALGIPVLILGVLIFDMIYITISRIKNGQVRNIKEWLDYRGHDHFHHRLMNLGFKEEEAVVFIYLTCVILGLSALVIEHARVSYPVVVLLIQATLIFINIILLMLIGRYGRFNAKGH